MATALVPDIRSPRLISTPAERAEISRNFARSGLTQREYAQQIGVPPGTLANWIRDARSSAPGATRERKVSIQVFDPAASRESRLEIALGSGRVLRVPPGFDTDELRRLIAVLDAC